MSEDLRKDSVVVMLLSWDPLSPLTFARDSMENSRTTLPVRDPPRTQTLIDGFPFRWPSGPSPETKDP